MVELAEVRITFSATVLYLNHFVFLFHFLFYFLLYFLFRFFPFFNFSVIFFMLGQVTRRSIWNIFRIEWEVIVQEDRALAYKDGSSEKSVNSLLIK